MQTSNERDSPVISRTSSQRLLTINRLPDYCQCQVEERRGATDKNECEKLCLPSSLTADGLIEEQLKIYCEGSKARSVHRRCEHHVCVHPANFHSSPYFLSLLASNTLCGTFPWQRQQQFDGTKLCRRRKDTTFQSTLRNHRKLQFIDTIYFILNMALVRQETFTS